MARILIVDDERSIRRTLGEFLREGGHAVAEAEHGEAALQCLSERPFDLVVTDIILPRVSGVELLRRIRASAPDTLVVLMTGEPTVETASEALRAGATDYLFKPITKAAIQRVVANAERLKSLEADRRRLEAENRAYQENLERLVEERTAQLRASERRASELSRFNQAALDALTAQICILGEEGEVLAVNEAWRTFAAANPPPPAGLSVGANYLAACEAATGGHAATAKQVADGIRGVARGGTEEFSRECRYAFGGADRWFLVRATRFKVHGPVRIVVAHADITARKQAQVRSDSFARLGQSLSSARTPQQAAQIMADAALNLLGWDACYLNLVSLAAGTVTPLVNLDTLQGRRVPVSLPEAAFRPTAMSRRVLMEGPQLILRDRPEDASPDLVPSGDVTRRSLSLLFVPIHREGKAIGVFSVQSYQPHAYDSADLETLQGLAEHGAGALVRLQAEADLARNHEQYRRAITAANAIPYQKDYASDTYVFMGDGIREVTGYSTAEFRPAVWKEMILETVFMGEAAGMAAAEAAQKFRAGQHKHWRADHRIRRRDGEIRWVSDSSIPLRDAAGEYLGSLGILQDITERKQAEAELATIFAHSPVMMCLVDSARALRRINPALARFAGSPVPDLVGLSIGKLLGCVHAAAAPADCGSSAGCSACGLFNLLKNTLQTGQDHRQVEVLCTLARGEHAKEHQLSCSTARLEVHGEPMVLLCLEDVTEQKLTQAKLLRAQRVESIGSLAGGIAHDLNNILAPIVMCAPMLQLDDSIETRRELAQTIESSATRAVGIVKQLLGFARGKEGQKTTLQLRHLVRDMATIARETFPRSIQIEEACAADLWPVLADATQIHQVILNLCVNARDAMPAGGKLTLRLDNVAVDEHYASMHPEATPGPYVRLRVSDTGTGIPDEVRDHIFESFFTTKGEGEGTGLGLTTVQGIVRNHKGFIGFTSAPGAGTTFEVHLPANPEAPGLAAAADTAEEVPRGSGELVLVVDDEAAICNATRRTLERYGYAVLQAHDGIEALARFTAHQTGVRVVVTDFMMPLMDGVTLCRALRALSPQTPVIVSSGGLFGKSGAEALRTFEELAVRRVLHKPHTAELLLRTLSEVLHPSA